MRLIEFKDIGEAERFFSEVGYATQFSKIFGIIEMEWKDEAPEKTAERFLMYWNSRIMDTPCRPSLQDYTIGYILVMYLINEVRETGGVEWSIGAIAR
jgi:hypothetical protein